jgi:hypothetical protein
MYTVEDINKAKQYLSDNGYGTGSNFTLNTVANLMAEWAAKNCSIPPVMPSLPDGLDNDSNCDHNFRLGWEACWQKLTEGNGA